MKLKDYFESQKGRGILSTADKDGNVNSAVFSSPHFFDDGSIGIIMRDRLSHSNLQKNNSAVYLFLEDGNGYNGKRIYLSKKREEQNDELISKLKRRVLSEEESKEKGPMFLVYFDIKKELPLIGN